MALANGSYTVIAQAVDQSGGTNAQTQLLPSGTTGPLIIDTVGPTVTNVVFARLSGSVYVTFQDNLSGLAMSTLVNGANYIALQAGERQARTVLSQQHHPGRVRRARPPRSK